MYWLLLALRWHWAIGILGLIWLIISLEWITWWVSSFFYHQWATQLHSFHAKGCLPREQLLLYIDIQLNWTLRELMCTPVLYRLRRVWPFFHVRERHHFLQSWLLFHQLLVLFRRLFDLLLDLWFKLFRLARLGDLECWIPLLERCERLAQVIAWVPHFLHPVLKRFINRLVKCDMLFYLMVQLLLGPFNFVFFSKSFFSCQLDFSDCSWALHFGCIRREVLE